MNMERTSVYVANGEFNAQQVKAFLEANGVPCEFKGEALRLTHALTLNGLGQVEVLVPPEYAEQARNLLLDVESGELELGETPSLPNG